MKCSNCNIKIGQQFAFAIKKNQCPACGQQLMRPEKLASYTSLQQLLKNNFPNLEIEKITNLVIANFELKQLFKEEGAAEDTIEVIEEMDSDQAYDEAHKKKQMEDAKQTINKVRDEAYEDALKAQYGMSNEEGENPFVNLSSNINPVEETLRLVDEAKKQEKYENMLSGTGGFRRSS